MIYNRKFYSFCIKIERKIYSALIKMSILLRYRPSFSSDYISATYYNTWRTYFNKVYFAVFADG